MGRWVLGILCIGACSQQGGVPPAGYLPDLGVGPLAEVAVRFCRAGRALSASGPAGFCVPADEPSRTCGQCSNRETCSCGRCAPAVCTGAADCSPGSRCRKGRCERACASPGDCGTGEECFDGVCLAPCGGGCRLGERCQGGRCEPAPCAGAGDCGSGDRCDLVRETANLVEPSVAEVQDGFLMAAEERAPAGSRIWLARSPDGLAWELDPSAALSAELAWEQGSVGAPALVVADGGALALYYEGGDGAGIGVARGAAAGPLTRQPTPVLAPEEAWEEGAVGGPAPLGADQPWIFYDAGRIAAAAGGGCASDSQCAGPLLRCRAGRCRSVPRVIGLARVSGGRLERRGVLAAAAVALASATRPTGEPLWGDLRAVYSPAVTIHTTALGEPLVLLFFTGVGLDRAGGALNRSLGVAASRDGISFRAYPFNPVLARLALFTQSLGESGPWALSAGGALHVYFDGTDLAGAPQLPGLALGETREP